MSALPSPRELAAVAEVMCELGCEIEQLGALLCGDPAVAGRHAQELQAIDLISQMQQALAGVLNADCVVCAVDAVRIESLRDRLAVCLPHGSCDHAHHRHNHSES